MKLNKTYEVDIAYFRTKLQIHRYITTILIMHALRLKEEFSMRSCANFNFEFSKSEENMNRLIDRPCISSAR